MLFIVLSSPIDYINNASCVCKNRNQFNSYQVFLDEKNLENPVVLILEGLLTLTICNDIVLKVITEGAVLQFIILYFNTYKRYSSQQLGIFSIYVLSYQSQPVQECNKKCIMMNFLEFHQFRCVICHLLFVQLFCSNSIQYDLIIKILCNLNDATAKGHLDLQKIQKLGSQYLRHKF
ncbi:unnamed protein product [Paramecium octaurelia]|uniref:Uncharacterized protein n=1 Tax=Paramecium octaurelia TaxID=43137 RepID=A0A8S1TW59_PAROT|nr:unnamed protein product [Paramecium octaurelia]